MQLMGIIMQYLEAVITLKEKLLTEKIPTIKAMFGNFASGLLFFYFYSACFLKQLIYIVL